MNKQVCKYNPLRDSGEVISGLSVNIDDMLRTGIVHSGSNELDDNHIDDPNLILGRVTDEFSAIDAMRAVRKYGKNTHKAETALANATENTNTTNHETK